MAGGHVSQGGMCGGGGGCAWWGLHAWQGHVWGGVCLPWQIAMDTVNERAVRILLECILVVSVCRDSYRLRSFITL